MKYGFVKINCINEEINLNSLKQLNGTIEVGRWKCAIKISQRKVETFTFLYKIQNENGTMLTASILGTIYFIITWTSTTYVLLIWIMNNFSIMHIPVPYIQIGEKLQITH